MVSSRRVTRVSIYGFLLTFFTLTILLTASKKFNLAENVFPPKIDALDLQISGSNSYIVDISVGDYNLLTRILPSYGVPKASSGLYGDLGSAGGWVRVEKDLLLGKHRAFKRYFSVKRISSQYQESHKNEVIVDVAIADLEEDCAVSGNTNCVPRSILMEINTAHGSNEDHIDNSRNIDSVPKAYRTRSIAKHDTTEKEKRGKDITNQNQIKESSNRNLYSSYSIEEISSYKALNLPQSPPEKSLNPAGISYGDRDYARMSNKRFVEESPHNSKNNMKIPSDEEISKSGWRKRSHNVWVKLGKPSDKAITDINVLFGSDAVDPRPNWSLVKTPLRSAEYAEALQPRLSIRRGPELDFKSLEFQPRMQFSTDGKFKVLQVADLHFSTGVGVCRDPAPHETAQGCQADPRTIKFLDHILDIEKPDFVAMTGDQIFGTTAPDPETALFKVVHPFIKRKIPFAIILGNHDDESILSRGQLMDLAASFPYSVVPKAPELKKGFGNYQLIVQQNGNKGATAVFYFLDYYGFYKQPKSNPGYDWLLKEAQDTKRNTEGESLLSMAFFHIPIPEFRNFGQPLLGQHKEEVMAPSFKTRLRGTLGMAGVHIGACGHDHANDFCLADTQGIDTDDQNSMWLCYGGGTGEGGYGGYGGYIRRVRVYELDNKAKSIKTWKRAENNPESKFDEQTVVEDSKVVTSI